MKNSTVQTNVDFYHLNTMCTLILRGIMIIPNIHIYVFNLLVTGCSGVTMSLIPKGCFKDNDSSRVFPTKLADHRDGPTKLDWNNYPASLSKYAVSRFFEFLRYGFFIQILESI